LGPASCTEFRCASCWHSHLIRSAIFGKNTRGLKITQKSQHPQNTSSKFQGVCFCLRLPTHPTCVRACMQTFLIPPTYLPTYLLTYLPTYLPTAYTYWVLGCVYVHTYVRTYIHTYNTQHYVVEKHWTALNIHKQNAGRQLITTTIATRPDAEFVFNTYIFKHAQSRMLGF